MISSEVQRTLVKSPPELWAELSDPASLARHLGELGEIRITKAEPEKFVEWEAEGASGKVAIKASGWGTKVTLTANREIVQAEAPDAELEIELPAAASELEAHGEDVQAAGEETEPAVTTAERFGHEHSATLLGTDLERAAVATPEPEPLAEIEPPASEADTTVAAEPEPELEPVAEAEALEEEPLAEPAEPAADAPETEPRRSFFARIFGFGRRRQEITALVIDEPSPEPYLEVEETPVETLEAPSEAPSVPAPVPVVDEATEMQRSPEAAQALAVEEALATTAPEADPAPEADAPPEADPPEPAGEASPDLAAELKAAEDSAEAEVTAILTGVLDRLGAAHHRPFSRS